MKQDTAAFGDPAKRAVILPLLNGSWWTTDARHVYRQTRERARVRVAAARPGAGQRTTANHSNGGPSTDHGGTATGPTRECGLIQASAPASRH